jgi:hypothetical protein
MQQLPKEIEKQLVILLEERRFDAAERVYNKWSKAQRFSFLKLNFLRA